MKKTATAILMNLKAIIITRASRRLEIEISFEYLTLQQDFIMAVRNSKFHFYPILFEND